VKAEIECQYTIQIGNAQALETQVCIEGGILRDSSGTCINKFSGGLVNILWNDSTSVGIISVSSSNANTSITINIDEGFLPGNVEDSLDTQTIETDSIPKDIFCSAARGGFCTPSYNYQWQQSENNVTWTDLPGATGQDLNFVSGATITMYYRRKVTEGNSTSMGYSDIAEVIVNPQ